ncbi:NEDD8-conjugating enzyme Ubc12 [Tritrichomonas musculus]|uniref:NEDD8-conjugating enzyme Ubc12 n=1 Tax=Tritrichomonas musculus TaxID=1915356 RepID=A0ABR2IQU4_9EUKA
MKRKDANKKVNLNDYQTTNPCQIRLLKDLEEVKAMKNVKLSFPDPTYIQHFIVSIRVRSGLYCNKWFRFNFVIKDEWPNEAPVVTILDNIWHPNITLVEDGGKVCVSILLKNYVPAILLSSVVTGLQFLLQQPNPNDARNPEAADEQKKDYEKFKAHVQMYLDEMPEDDDDDE